MQQGKRHLRNDQEPGMSLKPFTKVFQHDVGEEGPRKDNDNWAVADQT